ncbi:complement factor H-related protein 4-like isoform X4 [Carassius gibelio]|uniref:complement factor H-related protein 4-like isoform X4 n=1 Tax=Carassius gibelio TaxID=101364 RepID=UPI0022780EA1|nr:complement factor H-related protein 4-like isoform X4 [Carassius gibelio]
MKYWEMILFLLSAIIDVSTNAQEVTCEGEQLINVDILIGHPGIVSPYKPGHILVFRCTDVNQKMHGHRAIECQPDGKWDQAYPTCRGIRCEVPRDQHLSFPDIYFRGDMKLGAKHNYYCESGYEKKAEEATCTQDGWTPNPLCTVMTASSKCGTPPTVNNADTVEMTKKEYNTGERVEFICFNKYTLDSHSPFSKYLTCQQGKWTGKVKCLKPCAVTVEEMDERGIEPAFTDQQKLFAPHDDHITFKCQWGKNSVGFTPRHKCNDGVMTLPKCV